MFLFGKNKKNEQKGAAGIVQDLAQNVATGFTDDLKQAMVLKFEDKISNLDIANKIPLSDDTISSILNQCTNGELEKKIEAFKKGKGKICSLTISKDNMKKIRNLVKTEDLEKALNMSGSAAQIGTLAVLVVAVGLLYKINGKLSSLNQNISQISSFLDDEYKGKLQTSIKEVRRFTTFQSETIKDKDLRNRELINLKAIEKRCEDQINHANNAINTVMGNEKKFFSSYVNYTTQIEKWFNYQQLLLQLLQQISELTFTLNLGVISRENSYWNYNETVPDVENIRVEMRNWHKGNIEHYNVDLEKGIHIRSSKVHDVAKFIPINSIKDTITTEKLSAEMLDMITHQTKETNEDMLNASDNPFDKDVNLIVDEGELFFVPN